MENLAYILLAAFAIFCINIHKYQLTVTETSDKVIYSFDAKEK